MTGDLVERCREILEWKSTGLLARDGALRRFAASLSDVPERNRLTVAQGLTTAEAMQHVIEAAR